MRQAWGNATVLRLPTVLSNNRYFGFDEAATPDGQWLVGDNQPRNFIRNPGLPSYAVLYNVATHQMVTMQQLQTPQSQIIGASADADWVVWEEADDAPSFFDWTMLAYNRRLGQTERLGQAVKGTNGQSVSGPFSGPVVDHGHVLWSQPIGPVSAQSLSNSVVRMEDLTTGTMTTLAISAGDVNLSWPWASWAQSGPEGAGYIQFRNLLTGQTARLDDMANYLAIAGASIAYVDDPISLNLVDDFMRGTSDPESLPIPNPQYLEFVTMNDRLVAWDNNGDPDPGAMVYDRQLERFVSLPVTYQRSSSSWVGGHLLVWADPESAAQQTQDGQAGLTPAVTFDVIDTSTLPTSVAGA